MDTRQIFQNWTVKGLKLNLTKASSASRVEDLWSEIFSPIILLKEFESVWTTHAFKTYIQTKTAFFLQWNHIILKYSNFCPWVCKSFLTVKGLDEKAMLGFYESFFDSKIYVNLIIYDEKSHLMFL